MSPTFSAGFKGAYRDSCRVLLDKEGAPGKRYFGYTNDFRITLALAPLPCFPFLMSAFFNMHQRFD
jgi:hypothetical protein